MMNLKRVREALVDARVFSQAKRTAVVALFATPWTKDLIGKVGTRNLTAAPSAKAARPFLSDILRHPGQTIFQLWRADLSYLGGGDGCLWSDVLVKAHLFARQPPIGWKNVFSDLEDMPIFAPGDLKSVPMPGFFR